MPQNSPRLLRYSSVGQNSEVKVDFPVSVSKCQVKVLVRLVILGISGGQRGNAPMALLVMGGVFPL